MTNQSDRFTSTDLIAAATQSLSASGYHQIQKMFSDWDTPTSRLFEDEYNIVGMVVYDTCKELLGNWPDRQGSLVSVFSKHVSKSESKSWDGYLLLLTPGFCPSENAEIEAVRYNTTRLRKLVATGEDLQNATDVERMLSPLLPLNQGRDNLKQESVLDIIPMLLSEQGIPKNTTQILIDAFREQAPLLERLHQERGEK